MPKLLLVHDVAAPIERVFEYYSDVEKSPARLPAIKSVEMLTPGPPRVGTRWRETRTMFGRDATETLEIVGLEPGRMIAIGCDSCGCRYRTEFHFTPTASGTRVELRMEATALTFFAKLMKPLAILMMGSMKKMLQSDLEQMGAAAERA